MYIQKMTDYQLLQKGEWRIFAKRELRNSS